MATRNEKCVTSKKKKIVIVAVKSFQHCTKPKEKKVEEKEESTFSAANNEQNLDTPLILIKRVLHAQAEWTTLNQSWWKQETTSYSKKRKGKSAV